MPDPISHLLYWEAPWAPPPEVIRVQVSDGRAWLEITTGTVAPKAVKIELTAEQAQGLATKLHEASLRLSLPADQANAFSTWVRDNVLAATGARVPFWQRPR